jgi:MFS family permease
MITAWIAGMLSDRLGRRKIFVWVSTAVFAAGTFMLIHIDSVLQYYLL